ncbi:MAG: diguanylate cyclase [Betaproteobacteria bacterium]|nr:diguanylate cyclase [Betaproteobacteria bacterium]
MVIRHIKYKILSVVGISVAIVILGIAYYNAVHEERSILEQNERTVHKLTESVIQALQSVMLAGYADIAQAYADRLKKVKDVADFRILRVDGTEAFRDNATIHSVNRRRGEELFVPREAEERIQVLLPGDANLARVLVSNGAGLISYYETDASGRRFLTFLDAIPNLNVCHKCHGSSHPLRGIVKLTTGLDSVENEILKTRQQTTLAAALAIMVIVLLTGYMMGRSVVSPIERVTDAMAKAAGGDLDHKVPVVSGDELGQMANSFNVMTSELKKTYTGLKLEQDKLTTIIQSAGEGIVVTDAAGAVVLVNPAAERLLGKSAEVICRQGFLNLLDDPKAMRSWLSEQGEGPPSSYLYNHRILDVSAATIRAADGHTVGSAALLRDVTEQRRLEEELRRQSVTDALTGVYNRRHLDEVLLAEHARARRYSLSLSVLMLDVDHFKRFNDQHGHDTGDRVLKAIATTLKGALRNHDIACRYGGEEFMAILPNTTQSGGYAVAERLRKDIEELAVEGLKVTASIGVGTFPHVGQDSPEALIQAADGALYQAKNSGRNRVRVAEA